MIKMSNLPVDFLVCRVIYISKKFINFNLLLNEKYN